MARENLDPVYGYVDGRIDELKAELLVTKRELASTTISLTTSSIILNMRMTDPALLSKLNKKIQNDLQLALVKIHNSPNPQPVANEYLAQLNGYLQQ